MKHWMIAAAMSLWASLSWADIDIQEIETDGGINAWLVEDHNIPFIALEIRFKGGTSIDPAGKRGAAYFMSGLLNEGAGDMDAQEFTQEMERLAVNFSYDIYDDAASISAQFLTENKDDAVNLLRESLINPRFDTDAIERVRTQIQSIIESDLKDPDSIAADAFNNRLYGNHPYGTSYQGSVETITALTHDDLVAAHREIFVRDRLFVGAVGDFTADELSTLLDHLLGGLPANGTVKIADVTPEFDGQVDVIDFPTPQSVVIFGQNGISFDHPDFFAAYLLDYILGGGSFESRLMTEVREKRGLTYGISSFLVEKDHAIAWMGQFASANNRVAEAINVTRAEWAKLRDHGVTQKELDDAKTYLMGAYPLRFDGNARIASILVGMQMTGKTPDYINGRNARVEAVTLDQINRVARELLDPDTLSFTVVGQPEALN